MPQFVKDVEELRQRAIRNIEQGAVTSANQADRNRSVAILNEALATEVVCVLRYMHHYFMATGVHGKAVAGEFKEHADDERDHVDQIGERIQQLGGKPDFNPGTLVQRSVAQYEEGETLGDMIREDLIAERVVIQVYTEMIRYFADKDPTTRVMLEGILHDEEEHANDLVDLLYVVEPSTGKDKGVDPGTHPLQDKTTSTARREAASNRGESGGRRGEAAQGAASIRRGESSMTGAVRPENAEGELRPARATGRERPENRKAEPEHAPGTSGRTMRHRPEQTEEVDLTAEDNEEGAQRGTTRAVRVTRPNRKKRAA